MNEQDERMLEVLDHVNIRDIIAAKDNWRCPFCKSANYFLSRKNYLCQDCDACGDVIAYAMNDQQCSMDEAIDKLYSKYIYKSARR